MGFSNSAQDLNSIENVAISNVFGAAAGFRAEKRWGNEAYERLFLAQSLGWDAGRTPHFQPYISLVSGLRKGSFHFISFWLLTLPVGVIQNQPGGFPQW
jgi:hypothetical protein